jgi:LacI family transcriptional regulator
LKKPEKIRIKDIAVRAQVSPGTVDRVLHNRGEVNEETRSRILEIIAELDYTPNLLAKSLASKKKYRIIVVIPSAENSNPYWLKPMLGIHKAIEETKDFGAEVDIKTYEIDSEQSFEKCLSDAIKAKPDGIIFSPHFDVVSHSVVLKCKARNIPVVFLDTNIDNEPVLGYFGLNGISSGYLAARLMHFGMEQLATILILKLAKNTATFPHLLSRENGFLQYFKDNNIRGIITQSIEIDISKTDEPEKSLTKILEKTQNVKGIFVTNSRVHLAADILKKKSATNLRLIGYDLVEENLKYLQEGIIDFLICQKPEEQGYKCLMAMFYYLLSNKTVLRVNYSPIDILMKENLAFYNNF